MKQSAMFERLRKSKTKMSQAFFSAAASIISR
jgi:hypothetical protein